MGEGGGCGGRRPNGIWNCAVSCDSAAGRHPGGCGSTGAATRHEKHHFFSFKVRKKTSLIPGLQEEADATVARVRTTTSLSDMRDVNVVIECVSENEALKKRIFGELDEILQPNAILASNTSSISITRLAAATQRPKQVIGMHFMNPPPIMKLVEIVRGMATDDNVFATVKCLAERFNKVVICSRDYPGFIVNRVLMPMINEAFFALLEGVGTPQDIDTAFPEAMGRDSVIMLASTPKRRDTIMDI
ncbi:hypothetical protein BDL97_10G110600 [Sphagnum fallax]|nr:hypothetical protein BDL97_10G110600 [Sphagnum fallax]